MNDTVEIGFTTGKIMIIEGVNDRHAEDNWYYFWTTSGTNYDVYAPNVIYIKTSPSRFHRNTIEEVFAEELFHLDV